MKVAVYGAGGVGGYFGGRLAQAGAEVHLVARGAHLEALRRSGLEVRSLFGDFRVEVPATDEPSEIGPCDYVLFCVKSYDTEEAAGRLDPLLHERTAVLSLQNGVGNEEILAERVGEERVMGGVVYLLSTIAEPGVIEHAGGPARVVFGELDGRSSERALRLLEAWERAEGVEPELSADVRGSLWEKLVFICAFSGVTAAARLPVGVLREVPESWELLTDLMDEVLAVAAAEGIALPRETRDRHLEFARCLEPDVGSSLLHDLTHGNRMELEALQGEVIRRAERHGVPVPATRAVYALLRPWALRAEGSQDSPRAWRLV